jgi:hypothetical protein
MESPIKWLFCLSIIFCFVLRSSGVPAQESGINVSELLTKKMNQVRKNETITINNSAILSADPNIILAELKSFEGDPSPKVRLSAYTIGWKLANRSELPRIRKEVVNRLLKGSNDPDPIVWQQTSKHLLDFRSEDFSDTSKVSIRQLIKKDSPRRIMVLVAGVANMQDEISTLKKLLIDESKYESGLYSGKWYGTVGWAARLALGRMGSKEHIKRAIEMVESEPNLVIRVTRLLKDLSYIRQIEVIKVLQRYLDSDDRLPRLRPNVPGTRYAQHALDLLAQVLEDFPVKSVGPGGYSQSEIDICRKWMNEQNKWKINR